MAQTAPSAFDERSDVLFSGRDGAINSPAVELYVDVRLSLYDGFPEIEQEWRAFEARADGTAFQSFDLTSTWYRHIGVREGVTPAIVIGRRHGLILFILPLALQPGLLRRVTWLGALLNSCNAPLLAPDFSKIISPKQFPLLWRQIIQFLRREIRYDLIDLDKNSETAGAQINPFLALPVMPHPNDTYVARLTGTWDEFYVAKRSSSWRRTDSKKRRRLAKFGEVQFAIVDEQGDIEQTLDALIEQKKSLYAALGVDNLFERPGYRQFYLDLASGPKCHGLVHVSSVKVGSTIVAASFGLTFHGNYDYVLAGYTAGEFEACSPGTIHLQELMRYFLERDFKTFDFNIGDAPYKREWCDLELKLYDYLAPATMRGWLVAFVIRGARILKRFIKRNQSLWPMFLRARSLIGRLRR